MFFTSYHRDDQVASVKQVVMATVVEKNTEKHSQGISLWDNITTVTCRQHLVQQTKILCHVDTLRHTISFFSLLSIRHKKKNFGVSLKTCGKS